MSGTTDTTGTSWRIGLPWRPSSWPVASCTWTPCCSCAYPSFRHEVQARAVHILSVIAHPTGAAQQSRKLLMDLGERAAGFKFLVAAGLAVVN
jgi:putative transposase